MASRPVARFRGIVGFILLSVLLSTIQAVSIVILVGADAPPLVAVWASFLIVAAICVLLGGARLLWRRRRSRNSGIPVEGDSVRMLRTAGALWLCVSVISLISFLRPDDLVTPSPEPSEATRAMTSIDVRRFGTAPAGTEPIVAVHGGPGVPWTALEERSLQSLAADRMVVIYDQAGAGRSARLQHPGGYTFADSVRELAEIVDTTGSDRVDLIGLSWGASVATAFAVQHPDRVSDLALISPGSIPWRGELPPPQSPQSRLEPMQRIPTYLMALEPRNLFAYTLTGVDPAAAHWLAGDAEMDRRFRELYDSTAEGLHCDAAHVTPAPEGLGYYANQVPQLHPDRFGITRDEIAGAPDLRVLVVRGECDYIAAEVAEEYVEVFGARLLRMPDAGHALLEDQRDRTLAELNAFLR